MKFEVEVKINPSRRKPVILVYYHGRVLIEFPDKSQNTPENISEIVSEHKDWIDSKIKLGATSSLEVVLKNYDFVSGTSIFVKGDRFTLKVISVKRDIDEACFFKDKLLICQIRKPNKKRVRNALKYFLFSKSKELIVEKVKTKAQHLGVTYDKIFLKEYKNSWAHVRDNDLYFDWRIYFLSERIINYLVIHELLHFSHRNHGKEFYEKLQALCPGYQDIELKLKEQRYIVYRF